MITTPFIVCIIGLALWIIGSWPTPTNWAKSLLAEIGKCTFVVGLFWTVAPYAGKVAF